ncbi:MAG: hypothetical protein AAF826_06915 [Pseudomonadota bacterium]
MTSRFGFLVVGAFAISIFGSAAQSQGLDILDDVFPPSERLELVVDLQESGFNQDIALCSLVRTRSFMGALPVTSVVQHVYSDQNCNGAEYQVLDETAHADIMRQIGLEQVFPYTPRTSISQMIAGNLGLGIIVLGSLLAFIMALSLFRRGEKPIGSTPKMTAVMHVLMDAILKDGRPDLTKQDLVHKELETLFDREWDVVALQQLMETKRPLSSAELKKQAKVLSPDVKTYLYGRVMGLLVKDGPPTQKEKQYLKDLIAAFDLSSDDVNTIIDGVEQGQMA